MGSGNRQVKQAEQHLADVKRTLQKGRDAVRKIAEMQKRSLPSDREKAITLYKVWLLTKAKAAGLTVEEGQRHQTSRPTNVLEGVRRDRLPA